MDALFIGQAYIDVTLVADAIPTGDEKAVARDYAVSFGGNAVTAAFCCAKLGVVPDLMTTVAPDWLGRMFTDMAAKYGIMVHPRPVKRSSLSFVMPRGQRRAILRARDEKFLHPFPLLSLEGCRVLHLDGHLPDAALHYAKLCRSAGILTSLDGGGLRSNTEEVLRYIDVAIVAERLCEQMGKSEAQMLDYLAAKGCRIAGITRGERGMIWRDERGTVATLPALPIPPAKIVDTSGAGDIFHGAYVYAFLRDPKAPWLDHFRFARAAAAHSIQFLGNEASLPSRADIDATAAAYPAA
jgi:sugar/nucleoside kinase (ribokinase family)